MNVHLLDHSHHVCATSPQLDFIDKTKHHQDLTLASRKMASKFLVQRCTKCGKEDRKSQARIELMDKTHTFLRSLPDWHRNHLKQQLRKSITNLQRQPHIAPNKPSPPFGHKGMSPEACIAYTDPDRLVHSYYVGAQRLHDDHLYTYLLDHLDDADDEPPFSPSPRPLPLDDPLFHYMDRKQYAVQVWESTILKTPLSFICDQRLRTARPMSETARQQADRKHSATSTISSKSTASAKSAASATSTATTMSTTSRRSFGRRGSLRHSKTLKEKEDKNSTGFVRWKEVLWKSY